MENPEMTLSLEEGHKRVLISFDRDSDIYQVMEQVRGLLIAWGYHPNSVIDGCEYIIEVHKGV